MVALYEFDDIEYRSLYWTGRVAGHCDGPGDTGVENIEISSIRKEGCCHADSVGGCIVLLLPTIIYSCGYSVGVSRFKLVQDLWRT